MKVILQSCVLSLVVLCLGCCTDTSAPKAIPVSPTVPAPPRSKAVDLSPVKRDIGPVTESNRQLYEQIVTGKRSIYELNRELKKLEASRTATLEEWKRLTVLAEETSAALDESEKIQADQRKAIDSLEITLAYKGIEVAESEAEKVALREGLEAANGRIGTLVAAHNGAVEAVARVAAERDTLQGRLKAEVKWKWIFAAWALGATAAIAAGLYLKFLKPI